MPQRARHPVPAARTQRGLTIIELMISVTIGLIIVAAVGYLYMSSRGAYRSNSNLARIQEDGRFGLDAILRDARRVGSIGCNAAATVRSIVNAPYLPLALPGTGAGGATIYFAGPTTALFGVAPSGYGFPPGPTINFGPLPSTGGKTTPPPWIAGDVLQMVIPTSKPVPLVADADSVNFTVTLADNTAALQAGDYLLVSNCSNATVANVIATPAVGNGQTVVRLTATALLPVAIAPQMTLATHPSAQRLDAVTYYVGQFLGRPWPALYRYSATYRVAEEVIDHVENMSVLYGVGAAPPDFASSITPANWPKVTSLRVSLQIVGDEQSTAAAALPVSLLPGVRPAVTAPDTRLRQVFTATAALRNRIP